MSRPPTRRTFLSPADALEARTRLSAADCRDVSPEMLRYETLHLHPLVLAWKVISSGQASPSSSFPSLSSTLPLLRSYLFLPAVPLPPFFFRPSGHLVDVVLAAFWPLQCGVFPLATKGRSGDQPRATDGLVGSIAALSLAAPLHLNFHNPRAQAPSPPPFVRARRGPQHGSQLLPWRPKAANTMATLAICQTHGENKMKTCQH